MTITRFTFFTAFFRATPFELVLAILFVLDGILKDKGMVSFAHVLDQESTQGIYNYILQVANDAYTFEQEKDSTSGKIKLALYDKLASFIVLAIDGSPVVLLPGFIAILLLLPAIRRRLKTRKARVS